VTLDRVGNDLLIRVTETGKTIAVTGFFAGKGIEVLRFSDGAEWSRTQITDASVFRSDGHNNRIFDSNSDDVIHSSQGDDYISISAGNDTIFYGKGDGYDIVTGSASLAEHDRFVLTDLNASDIQLSRVGGHLIMTVKSTGEYVDFDGFFPTNTGDWETTARNIDEIKFANGESWNRQQIQQNAWYRGTDRADSIGAGELDDTIAGGKGDDVLEGGYGDDTFVWKKGDGNDQISDASSTLLQANNTDVDTLWLQDVTADDVSYSYQGKALVLTINSTGEQITVSGFFFGVTSLLTGAGTYYSGIDVIKFADGTTIDRQHITYNAGAQYLGWYPEVSSFTIAGSVQWAFFVDEFGHQGNIVGNHAVGFNDIWNARAWGGFGGALGGGDSMNPQPFVSFTDNTVNGSSVRDIMAAGDGKDIVIGRDGDDILYGDFVDDDVAGDNDMIDAGSGNDEVYGGGGMDLISGFTGNDYLSGGAGKDFISAGAGDDIVVGGAGDDS
jgi:Ca2+-binding RTX toxin-like protein